MRRIPALLCAAGLAAAPASAVAGPSNDPWSTSSSQTVEWSTAKGRLGVMVISLTPELRKKFGAPDDRGVLVAHVEPNTPASAAGIAVGDVIVEVRGRSVAAAPDVLSALADVRKGQQAKIAVVRDGKPRTFDATLADTAISTAGSPPWLRDWLKLDLPKPDEQPSSIFVGKLRELFGPTRGPVCQRS